MFSGINKWIIIGVAFILLVGFLSICDKKSASADEPSVYCTMTKLWNQDRVAGVPADQRRGWPPYDGNIKCENGEEYASQGCE